MMYWDNHMTTGGWIFSIAVSLIVVALIVAAFVWLFTDRGNRTASDQERPDL